MKLTKHKAVQEILSQIQSLKHNGCIEVDGTWGSFAPLLAGCLGKELNRPVLFISPHIDDSDKVSDDLQTFGVKKTQTFPAWEAEPEISDATDEIGSERLRVALFAANLKADKECGEVFFSTSIQAICQPAQKPESVMDQGLELNVNETIEPGLICGWLTDTGFEIVDRVDMPGQFAHRGGIIDIYAPMTITCDEPSKISKSQDSIANAVRIEFFDDEIESIRLIDLDSQRSQIPLSSIRVLNQTQNKLSSNDTQMFLDLLPTNTIVVMEEPQELQEVAEIYLDRLKDPVGLYPWPAIYKTLKKFTCLHISKFGGSKQSDTINLGVKSIQQYEHKSGPVWAENQAAVMELVKKAQSGKRVLFYCENQAERKRFKEIVSSNNTELPNNLEIRTGFINSGFEIEPLNTIILSHHELFGQYSVRRRSNIRRKTVPVDSFIDLKQGDYVVHVAHGIGRFKEIQTFTRDGRTNEFLTLEYAAGSLIHVPVNNIALVHKFVGSGANRPKLSKIGTKKWESQKLKVAQAVQDLASELLELQAKRENEKGISFSPDSHYQKEFEQSFPYQETPDQLRAVNEIKKDMISERPMDRLLCGDVGYGKTEIAMRAAFKAVDSGLQVAMLAPTTVLCVQHGRTFRERFADFPITIETLNRFNTPKEAGLVVAGLKSGRTDIVIGTHRLLSNDIAFKNIGLLIVDEEQRFGVEHKERIKQLRSDIDILTMTATPIPRTLHMSMLGLRDISSLATAPLDRRSVCTQVKRFNHQMIKQSILRELNRQGQIYFLHNSVRTIEKMNRQLKTIVPEAKIMVAHGQMPRRDLEKAMVSFVDGKIDILLCSTIIESGIDIPNANTIFINDADKFGLAQLHQLRGRVGRYKHRAYAYMLLPATRPVTPIATKRLKAIEEYSQLGAGFKIALRDLEIRGAGNILGPEQSGHINTVGYELYCQLLSNAVKSKQENRDLLPKKQTIVDLGFSCYIPKSYISSDRQRMEVYRKIALASNWKDLSNLEKEMLDFFGEVPEQVKLLMELTEIRLFATKWQVKTLTISGNDIVFNFPDDKKICENAGNLFAKAPGIIRIPDPKTVHIRLDKKYFEPPTLLSILRKIFRSVEKKSI